MEEEKQPCPICTMWKYDKPTPELDWPRMYQYAKRMTKLRKKDKKLVDYHPECVDIILLHKKKHIH